MLKWMTRKNNNNKERKKRNSTLLIRTMLITGLALLPVFMTSFAQGNELTKTYHVYVDSEYIGEVNDKEIVQQVVNEKISESSNEYDDIALDLEQSISMIPEKVFKQADNNGYVKEYLEKNLTIVALATEIKVGDQTVGYFKNEEEANEVLKAYKLKYIDEENLKRIENRDVEEIEEERLSIGDIIVSDIKFSKEISILEQKVLPDEVLEIEQGVKLLEKGTLEEKVHEVKKGEVLGKIASKYDLSIKKILELNSSLSEDTILQIDQELNVTELKPYVNVLVYEDKMVEEKVDYNIETIESEDMYKGDEKVTQKGKSGKKEVQYQTEIRNGKVVDKIVVDEKITEEPIDKIIIKGTKVIPSRGTGDLIWPADGGYISSHMGMRWGSMHKGIDIARPTTRAIFAADHGVVEKVAWHNGSYGNKVVINHNNGMRTVYAHLASIDVKTGQIIEKGTEIGTMGSTGNSTGIHLHFEVRLNGKVINPMNYY